MVPVDGFGMNCDVCLGNLHICGCLGGPGVSTPQTGPFLWTTSHRADTAAPIAAVWRALQALRTGDNMNPASDRVEPHGPFAVGSLLAVTPRGQDPQHSTITELDPGSRYAEQTLFGGLLLTFRYELSPRLAGGTTVTHTLEITGPFCEHLGPKIGSQISANFPDILAELLAHATYIDHRDQE